MKKIRQDKTAFGVKRSIVCSVFLIAALSCTLFGLCGCENKAQAATLSLESTLIAIQEQDIPVVEGYLDAVWFDPDLYSVSSEAFISTYFEGYSYEIRGAEENGDGTVTVSVTMTSKVMAQVLDDLYAATEAAYADTTAANSAQDASPFFLEYAQQHTWDTSENTYEIVMASDENGSWQIASPAVFGAILLNGYDPRQIMS